MLLLQFKFLTVYFICNYYVEYALVHFLLL
jgi:hypothetical protein